MDLDKLSVEELQELRDEIDERIDRSQGRILSKEEIDQMEWEQSFTLIERIDYGYGTSCYGAI
jgi:hypothetical protein